jgi:hypothetical protein
MSEDSTPPARKPQRGGNTKRTGELSEAAFLLKATSLGFAVTKPWGDSERYDFILDSGRRLWRVQIKCTEYERARGYDIQPTYTDQTRKAAYTADDIDVLVAHVVPLDVWYVLPVEVFAPSKSLRFYPDNTCPRARFEQFREAWHLLRLCGDGSPTRPAERSSAAELSAQASSSDVATDVPPAPSHDVATGVSPVSPEPPSPALAAAQRVATFLEKWAASRRALKSRPFGI